MADIQGKVIYRLRGLRLQTLGFFSNLEMSVILSLKKIQCGNGLKFWGRSCFVRFPGSSIKIGNRSAFRSDKDSNLIGISRKCIISTHSPVAQISIGDQCGFSGTAIGCKEKINIGNNVICGANTLITDFDWHGIDPDKRRNYTGDSKPVNIGNNVFLGYGSIVLKGVTIGENSVIGANSVVTKDIPANVIAGGNPCKVIKNF